VRLRAIPNQTPFSISLFLKNPSVPGTYKFTALVTKYDLVYSEAIADAGKDVVVKIFNVVTHPPNLFEMTVSNVPFNIGEIATYIIRV